MRGPLKGIRQKLKDSEPSLFPELFAERNVAPTNGNTVDFSSLQEISFAQLPQKYQFSITRCSSDEEKEFLMSMIPKGLVTNEQKDRVEIVLQKPNKMALEAVEVMIEQARSAKTFETGDFQAVIQGRRVVEIKLDNGFSFLMYQSESPKKQWFPIPGLSASPNGDLYLEFIQKPGLKPNRYGIEIFQKIHQQLSK